MANIRSEEAASPYVASIEAGRIDVSSHGQTCVFYSNTKEGNRDRAEQFVANESASGRPTTTLENTEGGQYLERENLYSYLGRPAARAVWDKASERYSQSASGECQTFVIGSDADSTFRRVELPELVQNERVDSINGIPREHLAELHAKDPDAAFNRICKAELERDRDRAGATPDFQRREALYREQLTEQGRKPGEATRPMSKDERDSRRQAAARQKELEHETATEEPQRDDREDDRSHAP